MFDMLRRAVLAAVFGTSALVAQQPTRPAAPPSGVVPQVSAAPDSLTLQSQAIRVFLDCQGRARGCDRDFLVTEINFVNWMRDRFDADVQILAQALTNGGGGIEYTITFIGRNKFGGMTDTLTLNTLPNDADDRIRRELARVFKLGLTRYVARSPIASRVQVSYATPFGAQRQQQVTAANLQDKWNLWTYTTNFNTSVRAEDRQQLVNGSLALSANRSTSEWKMNFSISGNINEAKFKIPATTTRPAFTVTNEQRTYNMNSLIVRSLSNHLSVGMKLGAGYSDFLNQDAAIRFQPAIEYNVFPWTEQTRRQLTLLYNVGPNYYNYQRTTVYNQEQETRFSQQVKRGLSKRDLPLLGAAMEQSTLAFHACAMASAPGILYFQPATLAALATVRDLREIRGIEVFATMDAGPLWEKEGMPAAMTGCSSSLMRLPCMPVLTVR